MQVPQFTLDDYEKDFADRHLLHGVVAKWAAARPDAPAILSADGRRTVTWSEFDRLTTALAQELLRLGFAKGDFLVTLLPFTVDHVLLEYSCFKIGVIAAPLDLRLPAAEVIRALEILRPRGFVSLGVKPPLDLRPLWRAVGEHCPWIQHSIVMDSEEAIPHTQSFASIAEAANSTAPSAEPPVLPQIAENDGALVIFTTGTTGSPKPALLSHRNITVQNMCLCGAFFGGDRGTRTLVNLPPSHVGGQAEAMMSTFFGGGTAVLLDVFDAGGSLRAIARHRVEILGQIPAMYSLEWMLKDYDRHDLSSLKMAVYGGHSVSRPFVDQLAPMSPVIGTGLGLTEAAGWCTYTLASTADRNSPDSETLLAGIGVDMPIYPCTIRQSMREDGSAGDELPSGEIGHVCFRGPQTFLGYINDPAATARAISSDGFLYTGDLGFKNASGFHLTGREKWVIKSFGYQIFPGDVERHVCALTAKVANCVVVGVAHEIVSEAVVAVVEKRPEAALTRKELDRHARELPTYMRPRHWIILEPGQMPLNRIGKPDYVRAQEMAREEIARLRARGKWDRAHLSRPPAPPHAEG
jgi:acyl-CoA synthetase (AMP-forming)/AMP-acid ligase II